MSYPGDIFLPEIVIIPGKLSFRFLTVHFSKQCFQNAGKSISGISGPVELKLWGIVDDLLFYALNRGF